MGLYNSHKHDEVAGLPVAASGATEHVLKTNAAGNATATDFFGGGMAKGLQAQLSAFNVYTPSNTVQLTTAYQDVPGITTGSFTPATNEYALVCLIGMYVLWAGTAPCNNNDALKSEIDLLYGGVDHQVFEEQIFATGGTGSGMVVFWGKAALTAGTPYVIKARSKNTSGARGTADWATNMMVWRIAR